MPRARSAAISASSVFRPVASVKKLNSAKRRPCVTGATSCSRAMERAPELRKAQLAARVGLRPEIEAHGEQPVRRVRRAVVAVAAEEAGIGGIVTADARRLDMVEPHLEGA